MALLPMQIPNQNQTEPHGHDYVLPYPVNLPGPPLQDPHNIDRVKSSLGLNPVPGTQESDGQAKQ